MGQRMFVKSVNDKTVILRYSVGIMTTVNDLCTVLDSIAPLYLAEDWDNVGLLIAPHRPRRVGRLLLTIDLTQEVLGEAIKRKSDMIVAYHPPIFSGLKRITGLHAQLLEHRIAVYSPHTALDATRGGLNDFLADGLGDGERYPIHPAPDPESKVNAYKIVIFAPRAEVSKLRKVLSSEAGCGVIGDYEQCSYELEGRGTFKGNAKSNPTVGQAGEFETVDEVRFEMTCPANVLGQVGELIRKHHSYEEPAWDAYPLATKYLTDVGAGRILNLKQGVTLRTMVGRIKKHLGLKQIRLAQSGSASAKIETIGLCPGAGGSLFQSAPKTDLLLTGEMRHHDVLAHNAKGTSVILTDHTNTERPYLPVYKRKILKALDKKIQIDISKRDADPLVIV